MQGKEKFSQRGEDVQLISFILLYLIIAYIAADFIHPTLLNFQLMYNCLLMLLYSRSDEVKSVEEAEYFQNNSFLQILSTFYALTETLRLYPAVPIDVKCCFSDDTLPDGLDVKKGDLINYQPFSMGRMKFLWGEDAEVYIDKPLCPLDLYQTYP